MIARVIAGACIFCANVFINTIYVGTAFVFGIIAADLDVVALVARKTNIGSAVVIVEAVCLIFAFANIRFDACVIHARVVGAGIVVVAVIIVLAFTHECVFAVMIAHAHVFSTDISVVALGIGIASLVVSVIGLVVAISVRIFAAVVLSERRR